MEQSPSWEANRFSTSQEIPRILWNRIFITVLTSARHLSLSWANSIQSPKSPPTSWTSVFNVILPSTSGSPQWSPSLRLPHQNPVHTSPLLITQISVQNGLHRSVRTILHFSNRICCPADNVIIIPYAFSWYHAFAGNLHQHRWDTCDNQAYADIELFYSKLFI